MSNYIKIEKQSLQDLIFFASVLFMTNDHFSIADNDRFIQLKVKLIRDSNYELEWKSVDISKYVIQVKNRLRKDIYSIKELEIKQ